MDGPYSEYGLKQFYIKMVLQDLQVVMDLVREFSHVYPPCRSRIIDFPARSQAICLHYGALAGATRRLVACSKAYPNSINRGSLQAMPVKLTPNGLGFALNPDGNVSFGAFWAIPNGTITVG